MPSFVAPVHPALQPYVARCVGYDETFSPDAVHHGLPSTHLTMILSFDEPLDCGWYGQADSDRRWSLAAGLHSVPALIRTHGHQHGIQLSLTPLGARALLGAPAAALAGQLVEHHELQGGVPEGLHAQLTEHSWRERFRLLQSHLLAALDRDAALPRAVAEAWRLLQSSRGTARVELLANHVGWSRRHLTERFRAELGLAPKETARIVRFQYAHALAAAGLPLPGRRYRRVRRPGPPQPRLAGPGRPDADRDTGRAPKRPRRTGVSQGRLKP